MASGTVPLPIPKDDIESWLQRFDQEEVDVERTLQKLLYLYPGNTAIEDVLPKVVVVNSQYSTGILATSKVARHILSKSIDPLLQQGDPDVVHRIAVVQVRPGMERNNYSFATKYCAWHNPCAYPMYDRFVEQMLCAYRRQDRFAEFRQRDLWEYGRFRQIVDSFRTCYGLDSYSFKEVDKFLWRAGQKCFPRDSKGASVSGQETQRP